MKFSIGVGQLLIFVLFFSSSSAQYKYGFLKPSVSPFVIKDLDEENNSNWSNTTLLRSSMYFYLINTDSSKFKVQVTAYKYFKKEKNDPAISTFTCYIDSSKIIQFDNLSENEKKERIINILDTCIGTWDKAFNDKVNERELFYDATFSAMRQELIKYWKKNKDEQLLLKYFKIMTCCTGDDGLDSRTIGNLFCSEPYEFCKILNNQSKKDKDYIVYRLKDYGIFYHIIYDIKPQQGVADEVEKKYENLLDSLVK